MGTKLSNETKRSTRKGRPNHPVEFKRRLAQQACEPGLSVSRLAQEHGVNANLLFKWRRHYRAGLFDEVAVPTALLPVTIAQEPAKRAQAESLPSASSPAPDAGIEVAFNDCTVRIGSAADMKMLRTVLALLRQ
ncbi:MAG TPA: transposase [Noviherbaspirillum sp.]|nr:transposase [Noviherbaspirillum sp.]